MSTTLTAWDVQAATVHRIRTEAPRGQWVIDVGALATAEDTLCENDTGHGRGTVYGSFAHRETDGNVPNLEGGCPDCALAWLSDVSAGDYVSVEVVR